MPVKIDPVALAEGLGQHPPTTAQAAVIAAPLQPTLVVAGAGAGKTETMAARVVWLVANGWVEPDAVLGLTFTRKAAQQLTVRIRQRLARLAGSDILRSIDPEGLVRAKIRSSEPEVSTYHAYAGRLLGDHGLLLPIEPTARLLSETELWQVAHRVVSLWDGDLDTDRTPASLTEAVLKLYGQLAEHLVTQKDLEGAHHELERLIHTLPPAPKQRKAVPKDLTDLIAKQQERIDLLPLVQRLTDTLRKEGALDFGSQMSLAARLAENHSEVGEAERARFQVVMLDEYQDTGHSQRVLLSALFGRGSGCAVTAVGDPMQSIYGWRGASAANLPRFSTDFPLKDNTPAPRLELLTSWRNPPEALALANHMSGSLRKAPADVSELEPRPGAEPGDIRLALHPDVNAEREWVATAIADAYEQAREEGNPPPTAAVLVRRNADSAPMAEALRARGLPVEVVGLGGLLHTPEVADVVAMLRVVADPMAGTSVIRLLTGARWQLGAADLRALANRAQKLGIGREFGATGVVTDTDELFQVLANTLPGEASEEAGLADALADPGPEEHYSTAGFARINAFNSELASLRERIGQPLTELVAEVERVLAIGIEVCARGGVTGREHLDAFADVVAAYANRTSATLPGLLAYLAAAESIEDGLTPGEVQVDPDRVQILTVHSAKGLEWEVVAVPHVVQGVFPSDRSSGTWLKVLGELPPSLRGDRAIGGGDGVPVLNIDDVTDRKQLQQAIKDHTEALATRRGEEDRRLFYVALTRTEQTLLVSGYHWDEGREPRGASAFLEELHEYVTAAELPVQIDQWAEPPEDGDENPLTAEPHSAIWPPDPLGSRRGAVESGAELVRSAMTELRSVDAVENVTEDDAEPEDDSTYEDDPEGWAADVDALLREREARSHAAAEVVLPSQLSVSQLVELKADPDAFATRLRRPLPYPPNPLARRGTAFHAWVEARFGAVRLLDFDELPGAADAADGGDDDLAGLQEAFLNSEWAHRTPVDVEVPFETSVGGVVLRGRIDAVFADPEGGWTVVDWKTGAPPSEANEQAVVMQLAAYRLAWAELMGASPRKVRAAFHYVRHNRTIAPVALPDAQALAELVGGSR
ncbi:MAG: ATP-dependent helicase [Rhodococcus sp.]|nr:ATP-dependent helicase [Rhodococcus sp. (in: high G+C Gram-positive bacteria)]